ncbi:MAG: short-chain dehydrogenase [Planctomycetota bacterium]|nr:MAG: short-chain dehydrogenase [Planctomycetota bacterium]
MEIKNKTVLILGGYGLVGFEVAKKILNEAPRKLILLSLRKKEIEIALKRLRKIQENLTHGENPSTELIGEYGNLFAHIDLKDIPLSKVKTTPHLRKIFTDGIFQPLTPQILHSSFLYHIICKHRPHIVIDSVNTATAISYQNIFETTRELQKTLRLSEKILQLQPSPNASSQELVELIHQIQKDVKQIQQAAETNISSTYIPQLVRHIQILYHALQDGGVECYVKVGTSGTGGMGLNIPYTHGEERPSRVLLSKACVGGAHTLLLFLLARTPDAPVIKEIKPTAAIAWREIKYGKIMKGDQRILLYQPTPPQPLPEKLTLRYSPSSPQWNSFAPEKAQVLRSVYIDTGENGLFSKGEFEAITSMQQMEFLTPEEIAQNILFEIKGRNTGKDVVNALDSASMGPTYRAGFLRTYALSYMKELEQRHQCASVAFEMLGPPRLSKLLFECHLLAKIYGKISALIKDSAEEISQKWEKLILEDKQLTSEIVSIGLPILLRDGKHFIRGPFVKIPPFEGENEIPFTTEQMEQWAKDGWVDLRPSNASLWLERIHQILRGLKPPLRTDTSSASERGRMFDVEQGNLAVGEIVGWIFNEEERGARLK